MIVEYAPFGVAPGRIDEWVARIPELLDLYFPQKEAATYRILQRLDEPNAVIFEVVWATPEAHVAFEQSERAAEIHQRYDGLTTYQADTLYYDYL